MSDRCTICGCDFSERSFGGPGICPSCDCGIQPVAMQRAAIEGLRVELAIAEDSLTREKIESNMLHGANLLLKSRIERAERNINSISGLQRYTMEAPEFGLVEEYENSTGKWVYFHEVQALFKDSK